MLSDTTPTMIELGEPGSTITLLVDGSEVADDIEVDDDGNWTFALVTDALSDGEHTVTATQTNTMGDEKRGRTRSPSRWTPTCPMLR